MGGNEGPKPSSGGDDGGRSGYDVTRVATNSTLAKAAFFVAFGIMMVRISSLHSKYITLMLLDLVQIFMIIPAPYSVASANDTEGALDDL